MRAPRWVRDFVGWRWAPFVALVAASLAFVLLVALLMPTDLGGAPYRVSESPAFVRPSAPEQPSVPAVPMRVVDASARPPSAAPELTPSAPEPLAPPSPATQREPATEGTAPVDFAANIADRGDRPHAPAARFSGH